MFDFIDTVKKKQPKPRYCKSDNVKELERLHFAAKRTKYPDNPYPVKTTFRDDTANNLTKSVIAYIRLQGGFAARINSTGIFDNKLGKYRRSGARKGMSDIVATIGGKSINIEIKIGRDKMRPEQLKVKQEVEAAGGIYIVASSFDNFLEQINKFENNKNLQKLWD